MKVGVWLPFKNKLNKVLDGRHVTVLNFDVLLW